LEYFRHKLPFGVAQIGRAYRNEISPRQGVIRLREFNQAELEYFVNPREKRHPNFERYANVVVKLLDKNDVLHEITLKEAVGKGIVCHELMAYFIGKTREFLLEVGVDELSLLENNTVLQKIKNQLKLISFEDVSIDPEGYRPGKINVITS